LNQESVRDICFLNLQPINYNILEQEKTKLLAQQKKMVEDLSDKDLKGKIKELRSLSQPGLTSLLIDRWYHTNDELLSTDLYQFFLDTKNQTELDYFIEAIENESYLEKQSDLISVLWQSSLDASDHIEKLVTIAIQGDFMTIIEVGTVIESFELGFEEQVILDAEYLVSEAMNEELDEGRIKLLTNLHQIISELHTI